MDYDFFAACGPGLSPRHVFATSFMINVSQKRHAALCALMALIQLASAIVTGVTVAETGFSLLTSLGCAFTCLVLLLNRRYFHGGGRL